MLNRNKRPASVYLLTHSLELLTRSCGSVLVAVTGRRVSGWVRRGSAVDRRRWVAGADRAVAAVMADPSAGAAADRRPAVSAGDLVRAAYRDRLRGPAGRAGSRVGDDLLAAVALLD